MRPALALVQTPAIDSKEDGDEPAPVSEIRALLSRARDQVLEVQRLRSSVPTVLPQASDGDGVALAEAGLRSLKRRRPL